MLINYRHCLDLILIIMKITIHKTNRAKDKNESPSGPTPKAVWLAMIQAYNQRILIRAIVQ